MADEETGFWTETQVALGKIIEKPTLASKHLKKPPFRFLYDIVVSVRDATGFPDGLYEQPEFEEMSSEKDKDRRIMFLRKLFDAIAFTLNKKVSASPAKIVGGQESEAAACCEALVMLAAATSASKADQQRGVKQALEKAASGKDKDNGEKKKEGKEKKEKEKDKKEDKKDEEAPADDGKKKKKEKEKEKDKDKEEDAPKDDGKGKKEKKEKEKDKDKDKKGPLKAGAVDPEVAALEAAAAEAEQAAAAAAAEAAKAARPATARRAPPVVKETVAKKDATEDAVSKAIHAAGVIRGGAATDDPGDEERQVDFEAEYIKEDHGQGDGEGGYMSKEAAEAAEAARRKVVLQHEGEEDGGIILGRQGKKARERTSLDAEVTKLREELQMLTKTTNPLGKAMDYIQEDADAMARELEVLRSETVQQGQLFSEQQKATNEALNPLLRQLEEVETEIQEQHQKSLLLQAAVLANDENVRTLLRMVVMPDGDI